MSTVLYRAFLVLAGVLLAAVTWAWAHYARQSLHDVFTASGWLLLAVMLVPALFGLRKRLTMLPLGKVARWTDLHLALGLLLVPLFLVHTGNGWPTGRYEQWMALSFWVVTLSGLLGWALQSTYPRRLTASGFEIQFERIPNALAALRDEARETVLAAAREATDTLAKHYLHNLAWYFARPRFVVNHLLGGNRHEYWLRSQRNAVARYLSPAEVTYLDRLQTLAQRKSLLDYHYALQGVMKLWLFLHIPAVAVLLVLILWHLVLVHLYAL